MFTRSYHFLQFERSPHVRTAGRALYHGSWVRGETVPERSPRSDSDSDTSEDDEEIPTDGEESGQQEEKQCRVAVGVANGKQGTEGDYLTPEVVTGKRHRIACPSWPFREKGKRETRGGGYKRMKKREEKPSKNKKCNKERKKKIIGSQPHGEGYMEFLDGWGVAQVS